MKITIEFDTLNLPGLNSSLSPVAVAERKRTAGRDFWDLSFSHAPVISDGMRAWFSDSLVCAETWSEALQNAECWYSNLADAFSAEVWDPELAGASVGVWH